MYKIFAALNLRALGDFTAFALFVSSIRELFDQSELYIYYRDDRPYKSMILSCVPGVTGALCSASPSVTFPIDYFDPAAGAIEIDDQMLEQGDVRHSDLVLVASMFRDGMLNSIPLARLRPPLDKVESSDAALISHGLDPGKWIATVYWKEAGYKYRGYHELRNIPDPTPYIEMIRHIIDDLGGQVVRLGHPTPTVLPKRDGLVDLAKVEHSDWLQLYAASVSRFMIGSASGPIAYGSGFGVPTAVTDQVQCDGVWRDHDYILTRTFEKNGRLYRQQEAYEVGLLHVDPDPSKRDFLTTRNTAAELVAAADEMFAVTSACIGWRNAFAETPPLPRPNEVRFPIPVRKRVELMIPPRLRPKPRQRT